MTRTKTGAAKSTTKQGAPLKRYNLALGSVQPFAALTAAGMELAVKPEVFAGTVVPAPAGTGYIQVREYLT